MSVRTLALALGMVLAVASALAWVLTRMNAGGAAEINGEELDRIGNRIWQNESAGTIDGLTNWEENFANLGIGHFIWYPEGVGGPYEETVPKLFAWLNAEGIALPKWVLEAKGCPWPDERSFERDHNSERQQELRTLLSSTLREQVRFIIRRLKEAIPKYRDAAGENAGLVERNIALLSRTAAGNFAMIDYINFKGEGLNPRERYKGEGWGLLQVLVEMKVGDAGSAPAAFSEASKRVLARRVANSAPERDEKRWLPGWNKRCERYAH